MILPPTLTLTTELALLRLNLPALLFALQFAATSIVAQRPVVPGVDQMRQSAGSLPAERGVVLADELGCTACHTAQHAEPKRGPDLTRIGARATSGWLRAFLDDPQRTKPGTTMPKVMPNASAEARATAVEALTHFLVSRGGPIPPAQTPVNEHVVDAGRALYQTIGCSACHAPDSGPGARKIPDVPLSDLARKTTIDALMAFLDNPAATHPSGRMPNFGLDMRETHALAMYLLREQIDNPAAIAAAKPTQPGLRYRYYEFAVRGKLPKDLDALEPVAEGTTPVVTVKVPERKRNDEFILRFDGEITIPRAGEYQFFTKSDDGSKLWIDGELVVDNDGNHAPRERGGKVKLAAGSHDIEIAMFEFRGGEEISASWSGPGLEKQPLPAELLTHTGARAMIPLDHEPFEVDLTKAADGARLYRTLGCVECHEPDRERSIARPLAALDLSSERGCIERGTEGRSVRYELSATQKSELRAAADAGAFTNSPITAQQRATRTLAAFNCYACHERDGIGGPEEARWHCFETKTSIDLGDEGRFPPPLTGVGDKLRGDALQALLTNGEHHVRRRFMRTRMPRYGQHGVSLAHHLSEADRQEPKPLSLAMNAETIAVGRKLVGTMGVACVTCHNVAGNRSPGIQGVDISHAHNRLNPDWFVRLLENPSKLKPGTRMPAMWPGPRSPFADLLDGSSRAQIEAVWAYLSLGASIPAPKGVLPPDGQPRLELNPVEETIVHRTFMRDVGPRTILAGFPERVHIAFDAQAVRLAKAWRGRFFDASGVASGRTDTFNGPLGVDVLDIPGPAFARLGTRDAAWPTIARGQRDVGGEFLGYRLDRERRPVFRYRLGKATVAEQPLPSISPGGAILRREFELDGDPTGLTFLAWRADSIDQRNATTWQSGDVMIELRNAPTARIRPTAQGQELVVTFSPTDGPIRFEQEIRW